MNRSRWQICLHSDNSLRFQYDFVIHFHILMHNSRNSKTTAVLIGCFFIEQSSYIWWDELRTNNVKAKTCLFTGQVDVQHMPFTYVTYNPDSRDNNLSDKRILVITNLETLNKKNKAKKYSVQYFLNCSYRLGRLKIQQASDKLPFLHRSYMRAKQNSGLLLREKQARQLSICW